MITPSALALRVAGIALMIVGIVEVDALESPRDRPLRLPNDTYPLHYQLHISSNIHKGTLLFSGNATIDVLIRQSTNEIVLHAKNLTDIQITVHRLATSDAGLETFVLVDDLTHTFDKQAAFLIIHSKDNYLAFGEGQRYRLEILYTAIMRNRAMGLYYMDYHDEKANSTV